MNFWHISRPGKNSRFVLQLLLFVRIRLVPTIVFLPECEIKVNGGYLLFELVANILWYSHNRGD